MIALLGVIMIVVLLAHWITLIAVMFMDETKALKYVCFSLFSVEFVFVVGNLLVRFLA